MAHVVVETPVNLTERQKELLREFDSCCSGHDGKHNPRAKGFMDKVKAFFAQ
jgi:molecular chaperone DnaJ